MAVLSPPGIISLSTASSWAIVLTSIGSIPGIMRKTARCSAKEPCRPNTPTFFHSYQPLLAKVCASDMVAISMPGIASPKSSDTLQLLPSGRCSKLLP